MSQLELALINAFNEIGFSEYKKITTDQIVFSPDVAKQCERNTCGMFGKNHACPPRVGNEDECKARILKYRNAFVVSIVLPIHNRQEMEASNKKLENAVQTLRTKFQEEDVTVMATGPCKICEHCTALDNKPCRFPDKTQYSMEGNGIDVVRMSINLKMTYNAGMGNAAFFVLVLYQK